VTAFDALGAQAAGGRLSSVVQVGVRYGEGPLDIICADFLVEGLLRAAR